MDLQTRQQKLDELKRLQKRVVELEGELQSSPPGHWQARGHYTAYYATTGFMLGMFGASTSLLFNVVGASLVGYHPLKLIQVYLTFPLGGRALTPEFDTGIALAIGCCLYIATGMLFGVPFQVIMSRLAPDAPVQRRLAVASLLGIALWLVNFYGILYWLQPLLFGGRWIVDQIPTWVAALTHLVFAWTMALVYPLGAYVPYRRQTEMI